MLTRPVAPPTFEIGLVMAGAASAGAYTAGVVDFLVEALQAWEDAKAAGAPVPDHRVRIRVAAGASAGGIVAALLAMLPFTGHHPVRDLEAIAGAADARNAARNLLYRCWVLEADLRRMLATDDVRPGQRVTSLLNGAALAGIADGALASVRAALASPRPRPAWVADPLHLHLSLTNMRGVPFVLGMVADEETRGHRIRSHGDHACFAVFGGADGPAEPLPPGAIAVNRPPGASAGCGWDLLRDAALATAAFPAGFPPQAFRHAVEVYRQRMSARAAGLSLDVADATGGGYEFWCVDGGLLDNEPVAEAWSALTAGGDGCAARALLLIDPFPGDAGPEARAPVDESPDLLQTLAALIPIMRAHAAFKPEDLAPALDDDVRTRFLIAPVRETRRPGETALASAGLAGFAGFVHEQLRLHDFQLGRRNCQKFLHDHFHLPADHPLFGGWRRRRRRQPELYAGYRPRGTSRSGRSRPADDLLQIIPLMPQVRAEVPLRAWPALGRELQFRPLRRLIGQRVAALLPPLLHSGVDRLCSGERRLLHRLLAPLAEHVLTRRAAAASWRAIEQDLQRRNLL